MGCGQMEREPGGLADLDRSLEQATPGINRAAVLTLPSGHPQHVGEGRSITGLFGVHYGLGDVGVHLLIGQQPRQSPRLGPDTQPQRQRPAHFSSAWPHRPQGSTTDARWPAHHRQEPRATRCESPQV